MNLSIGTASLVQVVFMQISHALKVQRIKLYGES